MNGVLLGLLLSHILFILSGITYSIYWVLQEMAPGRAAVVLFFLSILCGFGAAIGAFSCVLASVPLADDRRPRLWHIVVANLALLFAVYAVTTGIQGRVFTSELVFVMIWSTAEYCAIRVAFSRAWLNGKMALIAAGLVSLGLATGLVCYAIYFLLEGKSRFVSGLIPYGVVSLVMAAVGAFLWKARRVRTDPARDAE